MNKHRSLVPAGFTLIELLVSIAIAATLLAVAGSLYVGAVSARERIAGETELRETEFYLTRALQPLLRQAGYRSLDPDHLGSARGNPVQAKDVVFEAVSGDWVRGQTVRVRDDKLAIRFGGATLDPAVPDISVLDCRGRSYPYDEIVTLEFSMESQQLVCAMGTEQESLTGDGNGGGTILERMVVGLGVDDDRDGGADRFVGGAAASDTEQRNAAALELRLLLASRDGVLAEPASFRFAGTDETGTDRRLRHELVLLVALGN